VQELEKLISFSGTPTVVWRRTCEIAVVGMEFCMLTQRTRESLLGKYIYEVSRRRLECRRVATDRCIALRVLSAVPG
jgi:hypothetical protein